MLINFRHYYVAMESMSIKKALIALFSLFLLTLLSDAGFGAYGTLGYIDIYVPSQILPGQPVQVKATVYTNVAG